MLDALTSYQNNLALRQRLSSVDANNRDWDRDLSVAYNKVGDVEAALDRLDDALGSYRAGLAIMDRLTHGDPVNVVWQRDLMVSYNDVGDALEKQGHPQDAFASYRSGLAVVQLLLSRNSTNALWLDDLRFVAGRIGGLAYDFTMRRHFTNAFEAADQAVSITPGELWLNVVRADALMFLGRLDEARAIFLKYRGQKLGNGQSWEAAVLEDFGHFQQAGLSSPLMIEIERQFKMTG